MDTDSNFISIGTSDSTGFFSIQYPCGIKGTFNVTHLLYDIYSTSLLSQNDYNIKIMLNKNIYEIDEVVVLGKKPAFNVINGNIITRVSSIPGISNMPSGKILERLPGVTKDGRGSYSLNGTDAVIYINGVRQNLTPEALNSYLETLPATAISDIELLQNPPAGYDSNVQAAINIIIDKKKEDGSILNVGLFTGEQKGYLGDTGMELFYMLKSDNILFNTTFNYSNANLYGSGSDSTVYNKNSMQTITNDFFNSGRDNQISLNSNLTVNLKNDNSLDFNIFIYYGLSNYDYNNNTQNYNSASDSHIQQQFKTKTDGHDDLYTLTAKYSSNPQKKISFVAYYSGLYGGIRTDNDYNILSTTSKDWNKYMSSDLEMEGQMHTVASDFNSKFSKGTIEYGIKADYNIINDKALYTGVSVSDKDNSRFKGEEFIPAAYIGARYPIHDKLSIYAAIRGEYTDYQLHLKSNKSKTNDNYFNLFPTIQLTYNTDPYSATLSYKSFIARQNYMFLLPGERYINEYYSFVGNPELEPTKLDLLSLHNQFFGGAFSLLLQYQHIKDFYDKVLIEKDFKTIETPLNYTDKNNFAIQVNAPILLFKNHLYGNFTYTTIFHNYTNINPYLIRSDNRSKKYATTSMMLNFQYEITNSLTIDYLLNYRFKYKTLIYEDDNRWRMNFGISYSFLKDKRLAISADIENIFDTYDIKRDHFFGNNYMYSVTKENGPKLSFSLKYKFNKGKNIKDEYRDSRPDMSRMSTK
ncbi:MAG: outer membrane beta-barrel protein [Tannerella sp.]|nr:outer membrane beta-barrel protein [Tannerella sp.]